MERTSGRCVLRIECAHGRNCNGWCQRCGNTGQEQVVSCRTSSWKLAPALVANQRPPCTTCGEIRPQSLPAHPSTPSPDPARQKPRREDHPAPRVHPMVAPIWSLRLSWPLPQWRTGQGRGNLRKVVDHGNVRRYNNQRLRDCLQSGSV